MVQHNKLSRRRFLALGCGAICTAAFAGGCASRLETAGTTSSCPFGEVNDPYPGKCHRYVDLDGNGICDYSEPQDVASSMLTQSDDAEVQMDDAEAQTDDTEVEAADAEAEAADAEVEAADAEVQADDTTSSLAQRSSTARCPKGLVNDPYPGRCHHYIDSNGSGYCDLSETA